MANAKRLPSGAWRVLVYGGKDSTGERHYESFTDWDKHKAELAAKEYQVHHKEISRDAGNMTVEEAIDKYINSKDGVLSPSTIRGYENIKKNKLTGIRNIKLNKLKSSDAQGAINAEAKNSSAKTVKNINSLLCAVLKTNGIEIEKSTLPQKEKYSPYVLGMDGIKLILETVKEKEMELPIALAAFMGLRRSEICALKWENINLKAETITIKEAAVSDKDGKIQIKQPKSYAGNRTIPMPQYLLDVLNEQKDKKGFVVKLTGDAITKRYKHILKAAGIPQECRFHDLRHANASAMLALGVPDKYAMERMGHATNSTLKTIYQHTIDTQRELINKRVNQFFDNEMHHEKQHENAE